MKPKRNNRNREIILLAEIRAPWVINFRGGITKREKGTFLWPGTLDLCQQRRNFKLYQLARNVENFIKGSVGWGQMSATSAEKKVTMPRVALLRSLQMIDRTELVHRAHS